MAQDTYGNDLEKVNIATTGMMAINFTATDILSVADMKSATLPTGYEFVGLFTEDGGYGEEPETGDLINFFQDGYSLSGGEDTVTGTITFAEDNDVTRKLAGNNDVGKTATVYNGTFGVLIVTKYKNGRCVARAGLATATGFTPSKEERGAVTSGEFSFKWLYNQTLDVYYRQADVDVIPTTAGKAKP